MVDLIRAIDRFLFLEINGLHAEFLDYIMVFLSNKLVWIPLYLLIIWFIYQQLGKGAYRVVILIVLMITASDQISSSILKPLVARPRPCHAHDIQPFVHIVDGNCGGEFGFVSSHAANTFALATFVWLVFGRNFRRMNLLFIWAGAVSYSRIYLGVHYPLDIVGGLLVGVGCAVIFYWFYRRFFDRTISLDLL